MNRLIIFLIRKKLKLKKHQHFRFSNQKSKENYYYFSTYTLYKVEFICEYAWTVESNVSLNYLLSDACEVVKDV